MAALFGPSDDTVFDKANDTPDFEWSRSSDRKRMRSSDERYMLNCVSHLICTVFIVVKSEMKGAYYNFNPVGMSRAGIGMEMHIIDTRQETIHTQSRNEAAIP